MPTVTSLRSLERAQMLGASVLRRAWNTVVDAVVALLFGLLGYMVDRALSKRIVEPDPNTLGVLYLEDAKHPWKITEQRLSVCALPYASRDAGHEVLAYTACAHANQDYPTPPLPVSEGDAFHLARENDPEVARASNPIAWEAWNLDDPATYQRYRESVPLGRVLTGLRNCWYCETEMRIGRTPSCRGDWNWHYRVAQCPSCGWWLVSHVRESFGMYGIAEIYDHTYAVVQRFDPLALDTPLSLAREYLARNPHRTSRFNPFRFEELMADCLRDCYGDAEIVKVGGNKDRGIDIKAVRTDGTTTLIQVKRRSDFGRSEGIEVVRALHGVMLREGVVHGMVISTANSFSNEAHAETAQTAGQVERYSMDLLALNDVIELLQLRGRQVDRPWRDFGISLDKANPGWPTSTDWVDRSALPAALADIY